MKILYVTTIGITMTFFKQLIRELLDEGHTVDIMCNEDDEKVPECYREWNCNIFHHDCSRFPLSKGNFMAIGQIKNLVREKQYDIVHCHTPIAAMCTRVACKGLRKNGVKVIYTAHGFHFYKGAPKINWLIYYPIEKVCSYWTDVLITINHEDYDFAIYKMRANTVEFIPGVGVAAENYKNTEVDRAAKRKELGIPEDSFLLLSVGEINKNKNHSLVIEAIEELDVYYLIAGKGPEIINLKNQICEKQMDFRVKLLGHRSDVNELYAIADMFVFPSYREGVSLALMEAMSSGLPCAASKIRGNVDLIDYNNGGLFLPTDVKACKSTIEQVMKKDLNYIKNYNLEKLKIYNIESVNNMMRELYERYEKYKN